MCEGFVRYIAFVLINQGQRQSSNSGFQTLHAKQQHNTFMSKYCWYILLEFCWYIGNIVISANIYRCTDTSVELYVLYYSRELDKHMKGVGFLINNSIKNAIVICCPISSLLISIYLRAARSIITLIQVYAPTSAHEHNHLLQANIDRVDMKDLKIGMLRWVLMHWKGGAHHVGHSVVKSPTNKAYVYWTSPVITTWSSPTLLAYTTHPGAGHDMHPMELTTIRLTTSWFRTDSDQGSINLRQEHSQVQI